MALAGWREDLEEAHRRTIERFESSLALASQHGAAGLAESLKQSVRRMRQATTESEVLALTVSSSAALSKRAAVFVFEEGAWESGLARLLLARGVELDQLAIELKHAAAFFSAVETKDPVVAAASESELSPECFELAIAGYPPGERAYLFPIVVRGAVTAILLAIGSVIAPAFELLAETAAAHITALRAESVPALPEKRSEKKDGGWENLTNEERALHLRAQRVGRFKVSELRLYHAEAVRRGLKRSNLYGELKDEIDQARAAYRKEFPGLTDYLYLELLGNLANHEDRLLGPDFPGPLA